LARFFRRLREELVEEVCALGDFEEVGVGLGGVVRERFALGFSLDLDMGDSAHLLEAQHGAVERVSMFSAEWIAAARATRAGSPERIAVTRVNESDAKRHANICTFPGLERGEKRSPEGGRYESNEG
jgi:hypothetical protein